MSVLPDALSPASAPSNNVSLAQSAAASPDASAFGVSSKMANGADDGAGARGGDREACWFWFHNRHCSVVQELTVTSLVLSGNPSRSNLKEASNVGKSISSNSLSLGFGRAFCDRRSLGMATAKTWYYGRGFSLGRNGKSEDGVDFQQRHEAGTANGLRTELKRPKRAPARASTSPMCLVVRA